MIPIAWAMERSQWRSCVHISKKRFCSRMFAVGLLFVAGCLLVSKGLAAANILLGGPQQVPPVPATTPKVHP